MKLANLAALFAVAASASAQNMVHEQIKELRSNTFHKLKHEHVVKLLEDRHDRRLEKLSQLLKERKQQLEKHRSGRALLNREDHERVTRQVRNFQRKLDQLTNMDEEERRHMLETEAEGFHRLNSVDYLDFDAQPPEM